MSIDNRVVPIIAIYDNLLGYKNISIEQNEAVAVRAFTNSLIHLLESGDFNAVSPTDLILYRLGTLDMDTGNIDVCEPQALVYGTNIVTEWNISRFNCSDKSVFKEDKVSTKEGE